MSLAKFCQDRKNDLLALAQLLETKAVCSDVGPIRSAANACVAHSKKKNTKSTKWGYDLVDLQLEVDTPKDTKPTSLSEKLTLRLSASVSANHFESDSHDPFDALALNFEFFDVQPPRCSSYISWHFDRHITTGTGATHELHPLYHFQHGGFKTHQTVTEFGRLLLLAPPRLPHPPMDAILAIDFALANFSGKEWAAMRSDSGYENLVRESQNWLWRPYLSALHEAFDGEGAHSGAPIFDLWPNFLSKRQRHANLVK